MQLKCECLLLLSILVLCQYYAEAGSFAKVNKLLDLYVEKGPLQQIGWTGVNNFHNDLKQVSAFPGVTEDTRKSIYGFSKDMESVLNNFHRAQDKVYGACQFSLKMFRYAVKDPAVANRIIEKFTQAFSESKENLQSLTDSLQAGAGSLKSIDPARALQVRDRTIYVKELDDGTLKVVLSGELYLNEKEINPPGSVCKTFLLNKPSEKILQYVPGLPIAQNKPKVIRVLQKMPDGIGMIEKIAGTVNGMISAIGEGDDEQNAEDYSSPMKDLENTCKNYQVAHEDRPVPGSDNAMSYISIFNA